MNHRKILRTVQTRFPALLEAKFGVMRWYRRARGVPFERDFEALSLFPDRDGPYLDVGANRGQSADAILLKTRAGPIHLFEPQAHLCQKLHRLFDGDDRIVIHDFGLGDETSERVLYVPVYRGWTFDGLGSFDRGFAARWLRKRIYGFDEGRLSILEVPCRIRRLDEMGMDPFFIKLDIQGYELKALMGGPDTIRASTPILLVESPPSKQLIEYTGKLGYERFAFEEGTFFAGANGAKNTFFMTPDKASLVKTRTRRSTARPAPAYRAAPPAGPPA